MKPSKSPHKNTKNAKKSPILDLTESPCTEDVSHAYQGLLELKSKTHESYNNMSISLKKINSIIQENTVPPEKINDLHKYKEHIELSQQDIKDDLDKMEKIESVFQNICKKPQK